MNFPATNPRVINDLFAGVQEALFGKNITQQQVRSRERESASESTSHR